MAEEGDMDRSHLVVQGPVHMVGTTEQAINYINFRINPKEQEPRMYFRPLPAGPEQDANSGERQGESDISESLVELVISTKFRDDVQIQVENVNQMNFFLAVIPHIHVQTFYLREIKNNTGLPSSVAMSLDKALSNHPTLKRVWLQAVNVTADSEIEDSDARDEGRHYSIAASILKHPQSCIQDIMVEGYGSTGTLRNPIADGCWSPEGRAEVLSKHMMSFLQALRENGSVHTVSFVKTNLRLNEKHDEAQATSMILHLGQTLCKNRSIEKLYLGNLLENLSQEGIESFAKSIRHMKGLKVLDLRLIHRLVNPRPDLRFGNHMQISPRHRHLSSDHHQSNHRDATFIENEGPQPCLLKPIVDALEENCSLTKILGWKKYFQCSESLDPKARQAQEEKDTALENDLNYQLQLNRSRAKQFVHEPRLSIGAWSYVLEKCRGNPTAMYYCLRYKVASVCV
ncbi:MAG: hypothetical protein SGBAC_013359 [Bacillariaceae sp.]